MNPPVSFIKARLDPTRVGNPQHLADITEDEPRLVVDLNSADVLALQ